MTLFEPIKEIPRELIEKRTRNSKTHSLGGRKFAWDGTIGAIHYKDNPKDDREQWKDIDTTIVNGKVNKAPYDLDIYLTGKPGFHYKSKESGEFDIRLKAARKTEFALDEKANIVTPIIEGNKVTWHDYYQDVDVILEVQNTRVSLKRLIKSDKAPLDYDVDIQEIKGVARLLPLRPAEDANKQSIKMEEKSITGGRNEKLILEAITEEGEIAKPILYPILDATTIDEQVGADADDAQELVSNGAVLIAEQEIPIGNQYVARHVGGRFQTVAVPNGATIDTAYLSFYPTYSDSGAVVYRWYGEKVADSAAFTTDADNISGRDRTTAYAEENPPANWTASSWVNSVEINTEVEEIVGQGTWVSGNDLALLSIYQSGTGERIFCSHDGNSDEAPKLHIEYTAGGATNRQQVMVY